MSAIDALKEVGRAVVEPQERRICSIRRATFMLAMVVIPAGPVVTLGIGIPVGSGSESV